MNFIFSLNLLGIVQNNSAWKGTIYRGVQKFRRVQYIGGGGGFHGYEVARGLGEGQRF